MDLSSLSVKNKIGIIKRFAFFEVFVAFLVTLYHSKNLFWGQLYGEPFDTRLMILIHEHWWRWFNGKTSFRNMEFFYPIENSFGYSDTFLVQGLLHSLFRLIGFPMVQAWLITTFLCLLFGMIGWAYLSRLVLKSVMLRIFFIFALGVSYNFTIHFHFFPNFVGYTWISWILLALIKFWKHEESNSKKYIQLFYLILGIQLMMLSAWYAAFFIILILVIYAIFYIILNLKSLKLKIILDSKIKTLFFLFTPISFSLFFLFYYIYNIANDNVKGSIYELLTNSTNFGVLADGAHFGGGPLNFIYNYFGYDEGPLSDYGLGIGILFTLIVIIVVLYTFRNQFINDKIIYNLILVFVASIVLFFYFVKWPFGFSFHQYFFNLIPGFGSIRSPERYLTIFAFIVTIIFFILLDKLDFKKISIFSRFGIGFTFLILVLDQARDLPGESWSQDIFVDSKFDTQAIDIKKNCDFFIYDAPGGWWSDQLKAMGFAYQIDVPTVNGYSGYWPPGYPKQEWLHEGDISGTLNWIQQIPKNKRGCFTTGDLPIFYLSSTENRFDFEDGFTDRETNGEDYWQWATRERNFAFLYSGQRDEIDISFQIKSAPCLDKKQVDIIKLPKMKIMTINLDTNVKKVEFRLPLQDRELAKLEFRTDQNYCKVGNDPRSLHFEIKNLVMTSSKN